MPGRRTPSITADDLGSYYVHENGSVWRLVLYAAEPTATLERLDPFDVAREEGRTPTRLGGVVGSPIFEGFRKLAPIHEAD